MTHGLVQTSGVVAAAILMTLPASAGAQPASTRQLEALSARPANRAVQADLLSILKPVDRIDSGMFRMLHGVGLTTQSHGTRFHGVCERDSMTLWYAPAEEVSEGRAEDQPVKPYSLQSHPTFLFLSPPGPDGFILADAPMVWSAKCRAADKREDGWFSADDEFSAVQGALVLDLALREVQADRLKPAPCPDLLDRSQTCAQAILAVGDLSRIGGIEPCPATEGSLCYVIDLAGSTKLTIVGRGDRQSALPSAIQSIAIEQYIIVT